MSVSAVIVNYNAGSLLQQSIDSILTQVNEIIVIDNASSDGSIEQCCCLYADDPAVKIIKNKTNLGFSAACNQGIAASSGDMVLFLNPDARLQENACQVLVETLLSAPDIGMVGGRLCDQSFIEQPGGRRRFPTPWTSLGKIFPFLKVKKDFLWESCSFDLHAAPLPAAPIDVEAISGACMLVKKAAINQVGLWDEGYFLHCEDLDWCMRFHRSGWRVLFVPSVNVIHAQGGCSSRKLFVEWHKHKGMLRFYRKFYRSQYSIFLEWLVYFAILLRFLIIAIKVIFEHCWRAMVGASRGR